jgi:integrative and conjugative element protein (TIGR02256 family)
MSLVQGIRLTQSAAAFIQHESSQKLPAETGGILVGRYDGSLADMVHAVGPGALAQHNASRFTRDGAYAQEQLDTLYVASEGVYDYLGEWHSHPSPQGPSAVDCASLRWISTNPAYGCPCPILILCQRNAHTRWRLLAYQWQQRALVPLHLVRTH